jgi:hypothetical protein
MAFETGVSAIASIAAQSASIAPRRRHQLRTGRDSLVLLAAVVFDVVSKNRKKAG